MAKLTIIAGARPNFIKIAPIIHAIESDARFRKSLKYRLVHTGQHFDRNMSDTFFKELNIPEPHVNLNAGGGSQAEQTAKIMVGFEKELKQNPSDIVIVVGDVTSTLACSIVAKKELCKVAHIEAGIRSFDLTMPEEINRMVTDSITDYYFTTSDYANRNLFKLGVKKEVIFFVGNVMIDTLLSNLKRLKKPNFYEELHLKEKGYFVLTLHRPANVDESTKLKESITEIVRHSQGFPIIFPVHPRTSKIIKEFEIDSENLYLVPPLGYLEFNFLVKNAFGVLTDSGGITEETTVLNVPCMTLRNNTERPETCEIGTNELLGTDPHRIGPALSELFAGNWKNGTVPKLWDGKAAKRIVNHLYSIFQNSI